MSKSVSQEDCGRVVMDQNTAGQSLPARRILLALVGLVSVSLASSDALACSCAPYPEDEAKAAAKAFQQADVIFLGAVSAVKARRFRPLPVRDTTFDVLAAWKGLNDVKVALVRSAIGEIGCGYKFDLSKTYLVFAYWDQRRQILTTNMCELNRKESKAQGLIAELDKLKASGP